MVFLFEQTDAGHESPFGRHSDYKSKEAVSRQLSAMMVRADRRGLLICEILKAWQKAHALVLTIYESTSGFPPEERFGLTSQMRRAAVSIPTNIAEGCGRNGDAELRRFLLIAMGSASELEYLLLLARDLRFIKETGFATLHEMTEEVKRMLGGFISKLTADR